MRCHTQGRCSAQAANMDFNPQSYSLSFHWFHPCNLRKYMDYCSFTDHREMEGWVGLVGWPIAEICPLSGISLKCLSAVKYLGVYVVSAKCFKLSVDHLKVKFYRAFNCIYSRVKAPNYELVTVQLLKSYCLPFLLYASEAVRPSCSNVQSLQNCINRALFRIFHVGGKECIDSIRQCVGLPNLSILIERKRQKFVDRLLTNNQCSKLFLMNVDYWFCCIIYFFISLFYYYYFNSLVFSCVTVLYVYGCYWAELMRNKLSIIG